MNFDKQIRSAIENSTSDYDKEKLQERLAKLSGGVAVLKLIQLTRCIKKSNTTTCAKHNTSNLIERRRIRTQHTTASANNLPGTMPSSTAALVAFKASVTLPPSQVCALSACLFY